MSISAKHYGNVYRLVGTDSTSVLFFHHLPWRHRSVKRSLFSTSSPSCGEPSAILSPNTNQLTKHSQLLKKLVIQQSKCVVCCSPCKYVHHCCVSTQSNHRMRRSIVLVLLRDSMFSFLSHTYPIRCIYISVLLLTHRGVLSGSYTLP